MVDSGPVFMATMTVPCGYYPSKQYYFLHLLRQIRIKILLFNHQKIMFEQDYLPLLKTQHQWCLLRSCEAFLLPAFVWVLSWPDDRNLLLISLRGWREGRGQGESRRWSGQWQTPCRSSWNIDEVKEEEEGKEEKRKKGRRGGLTPFKWTEKDKKGWMMTWFEHVCALLDTPPSLC